MSSSTQSPNMGLVVPTPGSDAGPQYATDINTTLGIIDAHNHSNGNGVQINPSGLNINTALTFNNNFATNIAGLTLTPQSSAPVAGSLYINSSGFLTYVDLATATVIPITNSSGVAGTPGSIANLATPASASYTSPTFTFQSNTGIAGNLDAAALLMRNISPNSTFALTLQPPAALGSNYSVTLPALPSGTSFTTMTASGVLSASVPTVNGITRGNLAAVGQQISSSCNSFGTNSLSFIPVNNLSITITTTGRPVFIGLQPDGSGSAGYLGLSTGSQTSGLGVLQILRSGTAIYTSQIVIQATTATLLTQAPIGSVFLLDTPAAGTYTYTAVVRVNNVNSTISVNASVLFGYEL